MTKKFNLYYRLRVVVNTDPLRRCYNGCRFSPEEQWSSWGFLECVPEDWLDRRMTFWKELNDYAVKERGESARREFKSVEVVPDATNFTGD